MDIATEEFSHLEIVEATIQMLMTGINGDLKNAADNAEIMQLLKGNQASKSEAILFYVENMLRSNVNCALFYDELFTGNQDSSCDEVCYAFA